MFTGTTLLNAAPGTSTGTLLTSSNGTRLRQLLAVNTTGSAAVLTVWFVRSGDAIGGSQSYPLASALPVPAASITELLDPVLHEELGYMLLMPGDTLQGSQVTSGAITLIAWAD